MFACPKNDGGRRTTDGEFSFTVALPIADKKNPPIS
jgi:hypothetical protein